MPPRKADIFSKDVEFLLIDLVECRPILWDCTSELYKRVDLKDAVWEEVARSLGSHFSVSMVANRFKSMRDTFMSNLRRVKESKRSGKGTADIYNPKWPLYDRLKFLQKTVIQSTSISNLTISSEKLDDTMSQIEQTSNESLTQWLPYKAEEDEEIEVVTEEPSVNVYYNDSMKKFMIRSTGEPSDDSTDLSVSSASFASTAASSALQSLRPMSTPVQQTTLQNATVSISTASTSPVSTLSASKRQGAENQIYTKRGFAKRKSDTLMEEAVGAIKTLCQPDPINSLQSNSSVSTDSAHTLGLFIASRLREMTADERRLCENEILKLLCKF